MPMAIGPTQTISAGYGDRMSQQSAHSMIGHRTVMVIGRGVRRMAGRGLDMNPGVGRLTTMVVGFITTAIGPGVREVSFTGIAVGGVRHSSHSYSTFHSATTFAGIRCRITREIHVRDIIVTIAVIIGIIGMIVPGMPDQVDDVTGMTMDHGAV